MFSGIILITISYGRNKLEKINMTLICNYIFENMSVANYKYRVVLFILIFYSVLSFSKFTTLSFEKVK